MKKTYESPEAKLLKFATQDAITSSDISGKAGVNWSADGGNWSTNN